MRIEQIASTGDNLETLEALRQKIARTLDESNSGRDIAALSRQLVGVMHQIEELKAQTQDDPIGEILASKSFKKVRTGMRPNFEAEEDPVDED